MAHKWLIKREGLTSLSFLCPFPILQPMVAEFHSTRTNQDNTGQIGTPFAVNPNIAYLVVTFGRDYSRNH